MSYFVSWGVNSCQLNAALVSPNKPWKQDIKGSKCFQITAPQSLCIGIQKYPVLNKVNFTISNIPSKTTGCAKKQENAMHNEREREREQKQKLE